jgi:hypothetical protein
LRCDRCRSTAISIPLDGSDESPLDCEDCGADLGTLSDLKTMVTLKVLGRKTVEEQPWLLLN